VNPLSAHEIRGTWATLLLPIHSDDSIDYPALDAELDAIIASGVNGVYSNGTAGEFHTQSEEEFDRVNERMAQRCEKAQLPFQVGASHMSAQISLARLRRSKALKPAAFQIVLPDWFKTTDAEAIDFLKRIADEAAPIGLVLYNPPHAKRVLKPVELTTLSEAIPQLVGAKVAPTSQPWMHELGQTSARISIFTPGHFLATHYPQGARGSYSNVACLSPGGAQKWFKLIEAGDPLAKDIEARLLAFFAGHITPFITRDGYCNAAADKLLAAIGGWCPMPTRLRWPYRWIDSALVSSLRSMAERALPELLYQ
jgi:dihydrodipicolinate synthase/N-acetylneuraminate lyase